HKYLYHSKNLDSTSIANAHYKIGELYRYNFIGDSAYYHYNISEKIYRKFKDNFKLAKVLYGICVIQRNEKDLTGSELTSFEALSLLKLLEQTNEVKKYKSYIFNSLGLGFNELKQFKEAIHYQNKAIALKKTLKG
ncbi:hypothetical protein, partial [uncultured Algibacter sp.]|uniref:hypothetical protein n=1 Tax=uncultured Algibacter sp. TaxID=298659 RepID=UPI0032175D2F